jgi:serine/threonine protein kinase
MPDLPDPEARPTTPPSRSLLGGRYLLGDPIGSGGMGVVYLGTQAALQRQVAIKVLRRTFSPIPGSPALPT